VFDQLPQRWAPIVSSRRFNLPKTVSSAEENGFIGTRRKKSVHALVNAARVCEGRRPNPKPEGIARSRARVTLISWQRED
jgi:hypothetical protein